MKQLFDDVSFKCRLVTKNYSTSFSSAVYMLSPSIRDAIYSIYGFVRFADEIVDSFHGFDKKVLIDDFEKNNTKHITTMVLV
jgi:phytoene/squalene synthetase